MRNASLLLLALALLAGCGGGSTVRDAEGNSATMSADGSSATVKTADGEEGKMTFKEGETTWETKEGKATVSSQGPTEAELGLPFYPGSTVDESMGSLSFEGTEGAAKVSNRVTSDAPSKVAEFYKAKLTDPKTASADLNGNAQEILTGTLEGGVEAIVTATRDKGAEKTTIQVMVQKKG